MKTDSTRVAVLGLGYVGSVTAACLAHIGHTVVGIDRDEFKVDCIRRGQAPFYEPDLEQLIRGGRDSSRLSATTRIADVLDEIDIVLMCVGTPSEHNGNISVEQLRRASCEIASALERRARPLTVAVRSTAFPGTCEDVVVKALGHSDLVRVVCNPEFLREGAAVKDFLEPSLLVVGGDDPAAVRQVAALYAGLPVEPSIVELRTAELIKYACNSFHALKISFANEIGVLAESLGIPGGQVMDTLCRDTKLNVSPAYLRPGFAFGGSCLPKDLRAILFRASRMDLDLPLMDSVLRSNAAHLERALATILALPKGRLGVYGLSFKENTDDLRESPVVELIERLIGKGFDVRIYDPHIRIEEIYGSNLNFVMSTLPHVGRLMTPSLDELTGWASHLVLTQKAPPEVATQLHQSGKVALDLSRAWRPRFESLR